MIGFILTLRSLQRKRLVILNNLVVRDEGVTGMGAKPVVTSFTSGVINPSQLNSNLDILAEAIADSLDRAGDSDTNNQMSGNLDMGGFSITNVADIDGFLSSAQAAVDEAEGYAATSTSQAELSTIQAGLATASAITAAQQADLATSNGAAQVLLAEAQVALASGFASDAEDQADIATAQAVIAAEQAALATATTASGGSVLAIPNAVAVRNGSGQLAGDITGNSATATILQTARTIGGVSFNGSANINLPGVNTTGNQNTSGSSASAAKLTGGGRSYNITAPYTTTWDMDTVETKTVSPVLPSYAKIVGVIARIRPNDLSGWYNLEAGGYYFINPTAETITFTRILSGLFDTATFGGIVNNRIEYIIWYTD